MHNLLSIEVGYIKVEIRRVTRVSVVVMVKQMESFMPEDWLTECGRGQAKEKERRDYVDREKHDADCCGGYQA